MNIVYSCPTCRNSVRREFTMATQMLDCSHCGQQVGVPAGAVQEQTVGRCLVCPSRDLFIRKDIPQRLGVAVVVLGILGSSIAWGYHLPRWTFGILFATALVDFILFFVVKNSLMCYRCHAQYRGIEALEAHGPFQLETHERYRQMAARQMQAAAAHSQRPAPP
jgi:hypothetical protein